MSERKTLADLPAPDELTCRRLLALLSPPPEATISEPLEIEVNL